MSSFECIYSVYNITKRNNSFSIIIPGHYQNKSDVTTIDKLNKLIEYKSLDIHVELVREKGHQIKIGDKKYKISDFDTQKDELLKQLKNAKNNDL